MNCYIYIYTYISSSIMCIYVYYHETNKSWCILKVWLLQHLKLVWTHRDSNPNLKRPAWLVGHDWWVMTGRFGAGVEQRKVGHDEHLRDIPAGWWCPVVCALGSRLEDESSFGCTAWSHLICCLLFVEPCSRLSYDVFFIHRWRKVWDKWKLVDSLRLQLRGGMESRQSQDSTQQHCY